MTHTLTLLRGDCRLAYPMPQPQLDGHGEGQRERQWVEGV